MSAPDPVARVEQCMANVEARVKAMRLALAGLRAAPSHARQAAYAVDLVEQSRECIVELYGVATAAAAALYRAQEAP